MSYQNQTDATLIRQYETLLGREEQIRRDFSALKQRRWGKYLQMATLSLAFCVLQMYLIATLLGAVSLWKLVQPGKSFDSELTLGQEGLALEQAQRALEQELHRRALL
ncbi:hypothetical protein [Ferrimonas pelagia]|uniref:DUF3379 domain-containing protein n=1 Tax=Ferrimonas pelagia TaxID=1177826 RepID=A0ABP9EK87_9GAMM